MRLTNEIRGKIRKAAMAAAFGERMAAYQKHRAELGDALFEHQYGADAKIAAKLSPGWCETTRQITIRSPGFGYADNEFTDGAWQWKAKTQADYHLELSTERRRPRSYNDLSVQVGHPLFDQAQALVDEYVKLRDERNEFRAKINGLLFPITTLAKLVEVWPEGQKFVPFIPPRKPGALVPVELVPEINAAIAGKVKAEPPKATKAEKVAAARAANAAEVAKRGAEQKALTKITPSQMKRIAVQAATRKPAAKAKP